MNLKNNYKNGIDIHIYKLMYIPCIYIYKIYKNFRIKIKLLKRSKEEVPDIKSQGFFNKELGIK